MENSEIGRLQIEWLVVNALRENLSMLDGKTNVTYSKALEFAQENFKELFGTKKSVLGRKKVIDPIYERYLEEAEARSLEAKKPIKAQELIKLRIEEIERLTKTAKQIRLKQLKREKSKLIKLYKDNLADFVPLIEDEALKNDYDVRIDTLDYVKQVLGKYKVFNTSGGQPFVIRFLHPGAPETATGVDLIYEHHDNNGKARIIAVQYKIWDIKGALYYSTTKNLESQVETAKSCFCKQGLCKSSESESFSYRFPCCIPFLRPTDKLQDPDNLFTSAWHLPMCQVDSRTTLTYNEGKVLKREKILDVALNASEFERLFDKGMIGSRWFTVEELKDFYQKNRVLEKNDNSIIILSQKLTTI